MGGPQPSKSQAEHGTEHALTSTRRLETRERLLDAAVEVFAREGVQGASVEAICSQAHFTRGAFYSNFSSKEELFIELLQREFSRRFDDFTARAAALEPALRERHDPIDFTEATSIIATFLISGEHATTWHILETEFLLMALRDPELARIHPRFVAEYSEEFGAAIESVLRASGREPVITVDRFLAVFSYQYEAAIKVSALWGSAAEGGLDDLGGRLTELAFALTRPIAE